MIRALGLDDQNRLVSLLSMSSSPLSTTYAENSMASYTNVKDFTGTFQTTYLHA